MMEAFFNVVGILIVLATYAMVAFVCFEAYASYQVGLDALFAPITQAIQAVPK